MSQEDIFIENERDDADEEQTYVSWWSRRFGWNRALHGFRYLFGGTGLEGTDPPDELCRGQYAHHRLRYEQGGGRDQGNGSTAWDCGRPERQPNLHQRSSRQGAHDYRRQVPAGDQADPPQRQPQSRRYHSRWTLGLCGD